METIDGKLVVLDARWVFRESSGIGRYTLELLRQLGDLGGWRFGAGAMRSAGVCGNAAGLGAGNVEFAEVPFGPFALRGQWSVARLLRARGVAVYHSTNFMIPLPAFSRREPRAIRAVCNIHDLIPMVHPEFTPRALKTRFFPVYRALMHEIARRVDRVLTGSESAKRDIQRLLGVAESRIRVAADGVDARYVPGGEKPSARGGPKTILYVGRSDPYKICRAGGGGGTADRRGAAGAPTDCGTADARYPAAAELAQRLNGGTWSGWAIWTRRGCSAHQEADAGAALALRGLRLPVLEAMAGTPMVCLNVASLPEVAGDAARLVAPDEAGAVAALRHVLTDSAEAARLRAAGLARARAFTWRTTTAAVLQTYAEVLAS